MRLEAVFDILDKKKHTTNEAGDFARCRCKKSNKRLLESIF